MGLHEYKQKCRLAESGDQTNMPYAHCQAFPGTIIRQMINAIKVAGTTKVTLVQTQ